MTASSQFRTDLLDLAKQTVGIRPLSSLNSYGEATYTGSATNYACYIQRVKRSSGTLSEDEVSVENHVYIPSGTLTVGMKDEITFPDGLIRPLVSIDVRYDETGQQAVVLAVGKAG